MGRNAANAILFRHKICAESPGKCFRNAARNLSLVTAAFAKAERAFVCSAERWGMGVSTEERVCFVCLRSAGRFVSWRWQCVPRQSPYLSHRRRHDLIMVVTRAPTTPAIMPNGITNIVITATLSASRNGIAALPGGRRTGLRTTIPASFPIRSTRQAPLDRPGSLPRQARDMDSKPASCGSSAAPLAPRIGIAGLRR